MVEGCGGSGIFCGFTLLQMKTEVLKIRGTKKLKRSSVALDVSSHQLRFFGFLVLKKHPPIAG